MGKALKTIALTIVGCGLLAASATMDDTLRLHDEVRGRVRAMICGSEESPEAVRAALRGDQGFAALLEVFRRRTLASIRDPRYAEDAFQEALLKTWKGRPDLFLHSHDEILRYLRSATRKNLITLAKKSSRSRGPFGPDGEDLDEVFDRSVADPGDVAAAEDLLARLVDRLTPAEREALARRLDGAHSDRRVAAATGASRYAAGRATESIRHELARLLVDPRDPAA